MRLNEWKKETCAEQRQSYEPKGEAALESAAEEATDTEAERFDIGTPGKMSSNMNAWSQTILQIGQKPPVSVGCTPRCGRRL